MTDGPQASVRATSLSWADGATRSPSSRALDEHGAEGTASSQSVRPAQRKTDGTTGASRSEGGQLDWFLDGQPYLVFRGSRTALGPWPQPIRVQQLAEHHSLRQPADLECVERIERIERVEASDSGAGSHGGPSASSRDDGKSKRALNGDTVTCSTWCRLFFARPRRRQRRRQQTARSPGAIEWQHRAPPALNSSTTWSDGSSRTS